MKNIHWPALIIALTLAALVTFPTFYFGRNIGMY
jgi:hypothetical protein